MFAAMKWSAWAAIVLAGAYYAVQALPYLTAPTAQLRLPPSPSSEEFALRLHAVGGLVALMLGPWQFLTPLRKHLPVVHKIIGYGYIVAVAVGAAGAAVIAQTPGGVGANAFAFNMLAILWIISTAVALGCALAKQWPLHQKWMIRSFALTFAAVTLRAGMPVLGWLGFSPSEFYTIAAWASWTVNLILVEWAILPMLSKSAARAY